MNASTILLRETEDGWTLGYCYACFEELIANYMLCEKCDENFDICFICPSCKETAIQTCKCENKNEDVF